MISIGAYQDFWNTVYIRIGKFFIFLGVFTNKTCKNAPSIMNLHTHTATLVNRSNCLSIQELCPEQSKDNR
jgi:hypothetical protein